MFRQGASSGTSVVVLEMAIPYLRLARLVYAASPKWKHRSRRHAAILPNHGDAAVSRRRLPYRPPTRTVPVSALCAMRLAFACSYCPTPAPVSNEHVSRLTMSPILPPALLLSLNKTQLSTYNRSHFLYPSFESSRRPVFRTLAVLIEGKSIPTEEDATFMALLGPILTTLHAIPAPHLPTLDVRFDIATSSEQPWPPTRAHPLHSGLFHRILLQSWRRDTSTTQASNMQSTMTHLVCGWTFQALKDKRQAILWAEGMV